MVEILDVLKYVCLFSAIKFEPPCYDIYTNVTLEEKNQFQRYNTNNSINYEKLKEVREANKLFI